MAEHYQSRGNVIIDNPESFPRTGNLIYDDLGRDVTALLNQQLKGVGNIEDTNGYRRGAVLTHSNTPRALAREYFLRDMQEKHPESFQVKAHLLTHRDILTPTIWQALEERTSTYADLFGFCLYSNPGPNETLRQRVLDIFGKETRELSQEFPLIISGLKPVRADNAPFTLEDSGYKKAEPEPFLRKSGRYTFVPGKGVIPDENGISVWVSEEQSGIRRLYRGRSDGLDARFDYLLNSDGSGRVQVLFEPKARAQNL